MEKVSSFISKKVISLAQGSVVGYVLNVVFDEKLKFFEGCEIVDEESENVLFLNEKDILSVGEDCVVVEDLAVLDLAFFSSLNSPIGKEVYDKRGVCFGRVIEVEIKGKQVKKIITNKCEILQKFIQKIDSTFICIGEDSDDNEEEYLTARITRRF